VAPLFGSPFQAWSKEEKKANKRLCSDLRATVVPHMAAYCRLTTHESLSGGEHQIHGSTFLG